MKKRIIALLSISIFAMLISSCGNKQDPTPTTETISETESESKSALDPIKLGDIDVQYFDMVIDDVTGNWRLSRVSTDKDILDYALDYYNEFFESDEEIHAIINKELSTTNRISVLMPGTLEVSVLEYVSGEELSAKSLFGGDLIETYYIDTETGEIESADDEESETESEYEYEVPEEINFSDYDMSIDIPDSWTLMDNESDDDATTITYWYRNGTVLIKIMPYVEEYGEEMTDLMLDAPFTGFENKDTYTEVTKKESVRIGGKVGKSGTFFYDDRFYWLADVYSGEYIVMFLYSNDDYNEDGVSEFTGVVDSTVFLQE